jgi:hypothetical protein
MEDVAGNETLITAPPTAIKNANTVLNVTGGDNLKGKLVEYNSTVLFGDGFYDLKEGDIVQLYVENQFLYANFLSQNISQGNIVLRTGNRVVNMTVEKFQDSFTGLKMNASSGDIYQYGADLEKNQNQLYQNQINKGKKFIKDSEILDVFAGVLGFSPFVLEIITLIYKFIKSPGSFAHLLGILTKKITGQVKNMWKNALRVFLIIVVILEIISAILLMVAVILRTIGEKISEKAQEDKDYLGRVYDHF